ncbi:metallophosphoesterase family protein [Sediminitomix flava]|uniref:Phosphoesterase n=1 Tax=Sediminitomix flava TaxID=379075 RepID=A0A315ZG41_SEDFL|nr:metallophosphoesterase family protein [Sediminitomix flava]PWJ44481.1 hypothetical protein BC781_101852 [Sediminitomix flava]
MKIGILSDTHSYMDDRILDHLRDCDQIWHAGDIGDIKVTDQLRTIAPLRAVYGNIDGGDIRREFPEHQIFEIEGVKVWMTHIGGYPPKYSKKMIPMLNKIRPKLFICGHSHILKVIPDKHREMLHVNPGAVGQHGFQKVRTMITMKIKEGRMYDMNVIEFERP